VGVGRLPEQRLGSTFRPAKTPASTSTAHRCVGMGLSFVVIRALLNGVGWGLSTLLLLSVVSPLLDPMIWRGECEFTQAMTRLDVNCTTATLPIYTYTFPSPDNCTYECQFIETVHTWRPVDK
jgi:hypothetical protein